MAQIFFTAGYGHKVSSQRTYQAADPIIDWILDYVKPFMHCVMGFLTAWIFRIVAALDILWAIPETRMLLTVVMVLWFIHLAIIVSARVMALFIRIFLVLSTVLFLACAWHFFSASAAMALAAVLLFIRSIVKLIFVL
ncbi:hypothetical protein PFICI_05534 [Pestalotiopsis fici W106-1]|uniref:Uncharacterized protein n=1 Tax=Pestalotiopsis fici (strain W106-1 / CGMCC3.15140) TaxID=1229662 RepID=W3XC42_PESFW|nr:uncharacterized protein PFICI_05534 [Pestalotiopsis fici W106-1]ETS83658.1 hypothetical protein PFICI_05534 [Pestalotiopsis fici W106-1]